MQIILSKLWKCGCTYSTSALTTIFSTASETGRGHGVPSGYLPENVQVAFTASETDELSAGTFAAGSFGGCNR